MPNYGWGNKSKCFFDSERSFELRRIRDIQVRDIESRLYNPYKQWKKIGNLYLGCRSKTIPYPPKVMEQNADARVTEIALLILGIVTLIVFNMAVTSCKQ